MCLAVPGRITRITSDEPLARTAAVSFGGVVREVNVSLVPEAAVGDYVLTHVGFAISRIDGAEAERVFEYLRQIGELESERAGKSDERGEPTGGPGEGAS